MSCCKGCEEKTQNRGTDTSTLGELHKLGELYKRHARVHNTAVKVCNSGVIDFDDPKVLAGAVMVAEEYVKLISGLPNIIAQLTAEILTDRTENSAKISLLTSALEATKTKTTRKKKK